jgi:hypothetical protein
MRDVVDAAIAELAVRQYGCVTRDQLLALGLGPAAVTYRARHGRLHRLYPGVFAVGSPPTTMLERACAAVLACGAMAALSHSSSLTLWGFQKRWQLPLHVTAPTRHKRPGLVTHRGHLTRADIRIQLGIRTTSPARTFLDCAPDLPNKRLIRVINDGRRSGHVHLSALHDVCARFPTHPGRATIEAILLDSPTQPTRSEFEDAFLDFCQAYGLPRPLTNTKIAGHEVDALFEAERLIVELDSWDFHKDRSSFRSDRNRDADTLAARHATLRMTWDRIDETPQHEAARLHRILGQRREDAA